MSTWSPLARSVCGTPSPPERSLSRMVAPSRSGSVASARSRMSIRQGQDLLSAGDMSMFRGCSSTSTWKPRRSNPATVGQVARDLNLKKYNGAARSSIGWDGLRKDPELWFADGNCLVHLYARGQSKRGPTFKIPYSALLQSQCQPLLNRFSFNTYDESPYSDSSSNNDSGYFAFSNNRCEYELYIPAPPAMAREQAIQYHIATRNFFAWVFKRSLVGSSLGAALVGLLNSMHEFRVIGSDNTQDLLDFMDEEGYADMRSAPGHALALMHFSEHFHFKDLYIDAFAHCVGMHELLASSEEYKFVSEKSQELIQRARLEMDARLEQCGKSVGSFLEDELSSTHLPLTSSARSHLERFRSFLQAYYVAKLGYYPPSAKVAGRKHTFPKAIITSMHKDFQMLFDFLVNEDWSFSESLPPTHGGTAALQNVTAFDARYKYQTLDHPLPLIPDSQADTPSRSKSRLSFLGKKDKLKMDDRLVALSAMSKATNRQHIHLLDSSLVRAYRSFEKDCVFSTVKSDRSQHLSAADARQVRWLVVYGMLQVLRSASGAPTQVRDSENVHYNLCVSTADCPPFDASIPYIQLLRGQTDYTKGEAEGKRGSLTCPSTPVHSRSNSMSVASQLPARPQMDRNRSTPIFADRSASKHARNMSDSSTSSKGSVKRAMSSLGNMPELLHPKPQRGSFHEILVSGYGNGQTSCTISAAPTSAPLSIRTDLPARKRQSSEAEVSDSGISSRWSQSSDDNHSSASSINDSPHSPTFGRRDSLISLGQTSIREILAQPAESLVRRVSNMYGEPQRTIVESAMQPEPLSVRKSQLPADGVMVITQEVKVHYESEEDLKRFNPELSAYLDS